MLAHLLESFNGLAERKPLIDSSGQLSFALHLLKAEIVLPTGIILDGRNAGFTSILERQLHCFAALIRGWWRDFAIYERHSSTFAEDTGGLTARVVVNCGTAGAFCLRGYPACFQRDR